MENFITCKYISLVMLFEKVKMSVEVEMFTLIIFHKIKENIRSDNKEWEYPKVCVNLQTDVR